MTMPRMTEQELAEVHRRVRISRMQKARLGGKRGGTEGRASTPGAQGRLVTRREPVSSPVSSPSFQTFFVPGRLPGANDILRKHHMVYSTLKKEWGRRIALQILVAKLRPVGYCRIEFVWHELTEKRDPDNVIFGQKFVLDALRDTKIVRDDSRKFIHSLTHRVIVDPSRPGVEVTLIPVCVEVA